MNLHIKVGHRPLCICFLNLDPYMFSTLEALLATLQFLSVPLEHQGPEANTIFQAYVSP